MILGIDPGLSGAIALLDADGALVAAWDMPTVDRAVSPAALRAIIGGIDGRVREAWVEQVASMPAKLHGRTQGVASSFSFGTAYGTALGVLGAMGIPTRLVTPRVWKAHHGLRNDKAASRALALRLWPMSAELLSRVKDEARAEAALIARYGIEKGRAA